MHGFDVKNRTFINGWSVPERYSEKVTANLKKEFASLKRAVVEAYEAQTAKFAFANMNFAFAA